MWELIICQLTIIKLKKKYIKSYGYITMIAIIKFFTFYFLFNNKIIELIVKSLNE